MFVPMFQYFIVDSFLFPGPRGARGHDCCCRVSQEGGKENKKGSETGLRNSIILDVLANFIET